jgi:hypothetical protein
MGFRRGLDGDGNHRHDGHMQVKRATGEGRRGERPVRRPTVAGVVVAVTVLFAAFAHAIEEAGAQTPPSASEIAGYDGLLAAAAAGDGIEIRRLAAAGGDVNARDGHGRTPLMVAAYARSLPALEALIAARADLDLMDSRAYDAVTILAVLDDVVLLRRLFAAGASARQITSPYRGTALIAAAHLGHAEVVAELLKAGAPPDHVNSLQWTAVIEAIVLGDGGPRHQATLAALIASGADLNIPDGNGRSPLALARERGFSAMAGMLEAKGARP